MQNVSSILMEVVKEVDIVITCTLSHFLNHLKDNYLHKCTYNIHNINNQKDNRAVRTILEDIIDVIEKAEIDNEEIEIEEIKGIEDQDLNKKEVEIKEENKEGQDHHLEIPL